VFGKFGIGKRFREPTAVGKCADAALDIDQIIAFEHEMKLADRRNGLCLGIPKYTEQIPVVHMDSALKKIFEVVKIIEHEIFIHDVRPILFNDLLHNGRAQHLIERNDINELMKARPSDIPRPSVAAVGVKVLGYDVQRSHD